MLAALAAALLLTQAPAAPAGALSLTNVRSTYGSLGAPKPAAPVLPGDVLFLAFDIEGISLSADSKASYSMAMEVTDKAGKAMYRQEPAAKSDLVPLGGNRLPGKAYITIGLDQPPGEYNLKVTVVDLANKATKAIDQTFTVLPRDFGIVAVYTSIDEQGVVPAPTTLVIGQQVYIQFAVVGMQRGANKQPSISMEMLPFDEGGNPTMPKPVPFNIDAGVDEKDPGVTVRFLLPLTRVGKFSVKLKATDNVSKKVATYNLPIHAIAAAQ